MAGLGPDLFKPDAPDRTSGCQFKFNRNFMTRKFFHFLSIAAVAVMTCISCESSEPSQPDDAGDYNASENESFVENSLVDGTATRLWSEPAQPNADQPLTISFRAGKTSPLKGYTGDVYAHIGILEYGTWKFVQAGWEENIDKCKFKKDPSAADTWHLEIGPTVREYFNSGTTAVTQIGIVIRSQDSQLKGIQEDRFISVTDDKYKPFQPEPYLTQSVPGGCTYGINASGSEITFVLHDLDTKGGHKDYAYIMGDFNDWTLSNDDSSRMYRDDANGCWWLTVTGLDPDKEYRFQYHLGEYSGIDGEPDKVIRMSDPFAEKVLDPDNDPWINYHNEIYPADKMVYPSEEGASGTVACVKINRDTYAWTPFEMKNKDCPVIYEMLFGDYTATHDVAGAMAKLDYLQTLGVNAVELMPIQEFDGNTSWGYNPNHYFALDKAYGTREQYKQFIDECHKRGIAVIVDVVYNHSTGASPLAKLYWNSTNNQTASNNPYFFVDAMHPFNVFHDINHSNTFVQQVVKRSLVYLIEEYNVDGFRFDLSKGFTWSSSGWDNTDNNRIALIKDYAKAIRQADPDSYIILEHWGNDSEESQYVRDGMHPWKKMNHEYCETAMGYNADLSGTHKYLDNTWGATGWVTFMESHDEERMAYKQEKYGDSSIKDDHKARMQNLANNAVCFLTIPGPKMIWQMGELGYNYNKWCNEQGEDGTAEGKYETDRKPVKWDYYEDADRKALYDVYCKLNDLRNDNPDLFGKGVDLNGSDLGGWPLKKVALSYGSKKVWAYANYHGKNSSSQNVNIPSGTWIDILSGQTVQGGSYTLKPGQALVLVNSSVAR